MVKEQQNVWDFFGSTASFLEWTITYVGESLLPSGGGSFGTSALTRHLMHVA